ncbi:MAG: MBL fold metallo-hydrolase [Acidimicrobiaceae bacterium]|nr:MBL fold metallo-hydrolase [Acidimicrobiaceae bacterium]
MSPEFRYEDAPPYGEVEQLSPLVRRVVARNPSKFTYHGSGTFIIGPAPGANPNGNVAIIDPGPADDDHVAALLEAVEGQRVTHLLITHTHPDHSPATAAVQEATGATSYGFGPHPVEAIRAYDERVRKAIEAGEEPESEDGEGAGDRNFVPDVVTSDGDVITGEGFTFEALHTPGHISNHLCFALREEATMFTGDHVMGWSTTVVPAPDGDLNDYLANLRRLLDRPETLYRPTHGPAITDPSRYVAALIDHREMREGQIVDALGAGPRGIESIVAELYADVDEKLHKAAAAVVYAHLLALSRAGRAVAETDPEDDGGASSDWKADWRLV